MKICVIGGANVDISAISAGPFVMGDSNPGTVRIAPGGVGRNIAHNLVMLGDSVSFITVFGSDSLGKVLRQNCEDAGLDLSLSEVIAGSRNSYFVSLNGSDGELLGGVSDMALTALMTPEWLESRIDRINKADAVVADANVPPETLAFLLGCSIPPLYIDAVSSVKALRLREALASPRLPDAGPVALKCNRLEAEVLGIKPGAPLPAAVDRFYVSLGSEGMQIIENGNTLAFPAHSVTGIVSTTGAGDALLAGIVHAGPTASAQDAAALGQECARLTMLSPEAVSPALRTLA